MLPRPCPQEPIDGDLAARVFGLLQVVDTGTHAARVGEHARQRLDVALLGFFQNFRKVYIGEQVMHCSKVRAGAAYRPRKSLQITGMAQPWPPCTTSWECVVLAAMCNV